MTIIARCYIDATVTVALTEDEAKSLHDLAAFNAESVIAELAKLSPAWARDYGKGFASLLKRVRTDMGPELDRIKAAKAAFVRAK